MKSLEQIIYYIKKIGLTSLLILSLSAATLTGSSKVEKAKDKEEIKKTKYNITSTLNSLYQFTKTQTDTSFVETDFNRTVAAIEKDEIYYLCDFTKIEKIERLKNKQVRVYLRNKQEIIGNWIPNDRTSNFYRDENNPSEIGCVYGLYNNNPSKIEIDNIEQIIFNEIKPQEPNEIQRSPKKIRLKNDTTFTTDVGYIVDFCGHGWRSTYHTRLQNYCETIRGGWRGIPLKNIAEITFTGEFDKDNPQCREIILKYKDDKEQKESLFLTSESYGGICNHSSRFRSFDKIFASQTYGAVLIPLDKVKKIIPLLSNGSQK